MRPDPTRTVPPDLTALIGRVRTARGQAVALARLAVGTEFDGRPTEVVTWSAPDGAFVVLLPGEGGGAAPRLRQISVQVPDARLAEALASDFFGALPADLDGAPPPCFRPVPPPEVVLLAADGTRAAAPPGQVPLRPRRTIRWDVMLG